ncbi:bifunctional polynucleotide phosphatase/kinase, partial [Lecanoromycetidae sp. Uapishka_2]
MATVETAPRPPGHPATYSTATANDRLTDNASIMTLASSSKRRRRNSLDTNASVRALAPSSIYGGSKESLPLSVLSSSHNDQGSTSGHHQGRQVSVGLANAERASVYSSSGIAPALPSERNSYYAGKQTNAGDGGSDSTLIHTSSGNVFAKDASDWKWWHLSVPSTLKQLYADGYAIVILTNQGSVSLRNDPKTVKADQKSLTAFKTKVTAVFSHFDFPIALLAATARDRYRKPRTGMWDEFFEDLDLDVGDGPDLESSIFVGDAGGRAARNEMKADHSCCDRDLAINIGIKFKTPEEFFLHEAPMPFTRTFEPSAFLNATSITDATPIAIEKKNSLDIVLMCGSPGAGKSTFFWKKLAPLGYERINQDILKTFEGDDEQRRIWNRYWI